MTTSLAAQLQRLQTPQTSILNEKNKRASILFDASKAEEYDRDVYFKIGQTGFNELLEVNKDFGRFQEALFGKKAKDQQRAVETKEWNLHMDDNIEGFLLLLSPYLEKESSLKALEWLVHRFLINEMNIDALLMCIFPYYESSLFIRILQIVNIKDERHRWHWLYGAQKTGRPVTKQTVGARWANYQSFRSYVANYLSKMQKIHKSERNFKIAINFYVTTVVGGLQVIKKVKEEHITYLIRTMSTCFVSPHTELVAGMYFILAQLAVKTTLSQEILHNLLEKMVRSVRLNLSEQCIMCLVALCHHQDIEAFTDEVVKYLDGPSAFLMNDLQKMAKSYSVTPFISAFLTGFMNWLLSDHCNLEEKERMNKLREIMDRIESFPFSISDGTSIIKCIIDLFAVNIKKIENFKEFDLKEIILSLEKNNPEAYDAAVGQVIKNVDSIKQKQILKNYRYFIKEVLQGSSDIGNMFLHLMQPDDSLRTASVKVFAEKVKKGQIGDKEMILNQVKFMLNDDVSNIVSIALSLLGQYVRMEEKDLILEMEKLLQKSHKETGTRWTEIRSKILGVLTNISNSEFHLHIMYTCLPYLLFPHISKGISPVKVILKSPLATKQPLITAISLELNHLIADKEINDRKIQTEIWKVLPKVLRELSKDGKNKLWGYVENQLTVSYEKELLPHFLSMVILQQGLSGGGLDNAIQLRLAHKLADACVDGISDIGIKINDTGDILECKKPDWGNYLEQVSEGNLPTGFLYLCLQEVVATFKFPQACRQTSFWVTHMEGNGSDGYLLILLKVLKGAILLEHQGNIGAQMRDNLVHTILKRCLGSLENQFSFLAMVWGWQPYLPGSSIIDEVLQVWCINFGASYIESRSSNLAWALGSDKPIVAGLVSALSSNSSLVRSTAIKCACSLASVKGGSLLKQNQRLLLETLVNSAEAVLADVTQIPIVVSKVDNSKSDSLSEIAESLLNVLLNEHVPMHIRSVLLYALSHIIHPVILVRCLPMSSSLLTKASITTDSILDPATSLVLYWLVHRFTISPKALDTKEGWSVLLQALSCSKSVLDVDNQKLSPQGILMEEMSNLLRGISCGEIHAQLWVVLISHVVESEDSREASQLRRGLRKVNLDAQLIIQEINKLQLVDKVTSIRAARAKRDKKKSEDGTGAQLLAWRKLEMMLETMGVMGGLKRPWLLVGPLCECLGRTLTLKIVITDLVQQQILSTLLHLINRTQEELGDHIADKIQLNVELIVQCIRFSVSVDTQRRALLVLAQAANIFPDIVMHNMMPIFTFMGTSSLFRRDDSYSFQVINQTIKSIVPTLVKCETGDNELLGKLAQVCQVFVDAVPDLPEHRRLPLFIQLASTFKTEDHLWIILALIADSYVMKGSAPDVVPITSQLTAPSVKGEEEEKEEKRRLPKTIEFIQTLCSEFPVVVQLQSVLNLLKYVRQLPMENDFKEVLSPNKQSKIPKIVVWDNHTPVKIRYFKYVIVSVLINILSCSMLVHSIFEMSKTDQIHLKDLYKVLLDNVLQYTTDVSKKSEESENKPVGKFWSSLQLKLVDLLDCIISLLPPPMLIEVVSGLIQSPISIVRCKAMEILCAKMQPNAKFFTEDDIKDLLNFLHVLKKVGVNVSETEGNRQTALIALQLLTRTCAPNVKPFVLKPILDGAVELVATDGLALRVLTNALLVTAEAVGALKTHCVTHIGKLMPVLLRLLNGEIQSESEHLMLAAITVIYKLLTYVPQFLSPYTIQIIGGVCHIAAVNETVSNKAKESHLENRLTGIRQMIVKNIEPRILIPNFKKCYQILSDNKTDSLPTLMILVEELVGHIDAKDLSFYKVQFLELFKEAFDLRTQKGSIKIIYELEDCVNAAISRVLLRLNEVENISIFLSLQQWAVEATKENPHRLITFYRFANHLAGTLKVLFVKAKLADKLYTHAASVLERNNSLNHGDTIFDSSDGTADESATELVNVVLDTLTKVFLYDTVGFTNQARFNLMVNPLTDQLENCIGGEVAYEDRVSNHLIPCVIKFTVAVGDDSLWRDLNRKILNRLRNDDKPKIILGALSTFENLVDSQGEDYLQPLLADTMPYITEVLESLDSGVEEKTRNIFNKMEAILGDNLRMYLDR